MVTQDMRQAVGLRGRYACGQPRSLAWAGVNQAFGLRIKRLLERVSEAEESGWG